MESATRLSRGAKAQTVHLDSLSGRRERRLPIAVAVRVKVLDHAGARKCERTFTDNVSAHGVRIRSMRAWHPGEQVELTPLNEEFPVRAAVVYCQKLDDECFFVGFKVGQGKIPWAPLKRFGGI